MGSRSAEVAGERPFYALHAHAYDCLVTDPVEPWVDAVDRELRAAGLPEAAVLDAGCGTGRHARALGDRGHRVSLMDASPALLQIASVRCHGSEAVLADICSAQATGTYDAVTCRGVLNDLVEDDERGAALDRLANLTRPGGLLLLDVRESEQSQRRADGRPRTVEARLPDGSRLVFTSRPTWHSGRIVVDERYELLPPEGGRPTVHDYRFQMRPWTAEELRARLAPGFGQVEIRPGVGRRTPDRLFVLARR